MSATITILSPVPAPPARATAEGSGRRLGGRIRLGLLSNGKPNTNLLLEGMLDVLRADSRLQLAIEERKSSASHPADAAILARLSASADLVVGATAD